MEIVVTGGHLTPAYGFIEEAQSRNSRVTVIGALGNDSVEAQEFAKLNVGYHSIYPVKYNRYKKIYSILRLPLIVVPILQSIRLLKKIQPSVVVVFGSFNAVPVAIAAKFLRINVYLHEQTRTVGLANRIISHIAQACAVSYADTPGLGACSRTVYTGNVLRRSIWYPPQQPSFTLPSSKPVLFITGGNQGSAVILKTIEPLIEALSKTYQLIIQHGNNQPPAAPGTDVLFKKWFDVTDVSWLLANARMVITRGGANTTAEIMAIGVPAIIIPLPNASQNEQEKNAAIIAAHNGGIIISQQHFNRHSLSHAIEEIENNYQTYRSSAKKLVQFQQKTAAAKLYTCISEKE
jgi:UDP-N-acetylglucosamine--N-acetylmuramyl-(pentapeptide) pyrophosphoryl-undecaprenol N-acetylglucosamine transferase